MGDALWFVPVPARSTTERRRSKLAFDGNHTDVISSWIVTQPGFIEITPDSMETLVEVTREGHLSWVIFPPYGYRL